MVCEQKYRNDSRLRKHFANGMLCIGHTDSGWAKREFQIEWLKWFDGFTGGDQKNLLWDCHASHRHIDVKDYAKENCHTTLSFISAGQNGAWQPLDVGVFGPVKKEAHQRFEILMSNKGADNVDIIDAVDIFVQRWCALDESVITRAWCPVIGKEPASVMHD